MSELIILGIIAVLALVCLYGMGAFNGIFKDHSEDV